MVAQAPDRRSGRLAGAAGVALLLAGLTLLLEPPSWRPAAAVLLAAGLAAGVVAALRLRIPDRVRTPMERLNDAAFLVVIAAVALIAVRLARPWTAALPGLVGGFLLGRSLRPQVVRPAPASSPDPTPNPDHPAPGPSHPDLGQPGTPPTQPGQPRTPPPDPGQPRTPPGDPGAPDSGG